MALTKKDIAAAISNELNVHIREASSITESILKVIKGTLAAGDDVLVSRFGKFQVNNKFARLGRNPKTGEPMMLEPRRVVTYKPSGLLRERLNNSSNDN
jgi:integration host factor subunit alpha